MKKIFTQFFLFVALLAATANLSAQTYNGGTWYSLYDADEKNNVVRNTSFCEKAVFAPAESIIFDYKKFTAISTNGKVQVQNKVNGSWSGSKGEVKISSTSWNTSDAISLDENISHIRYYMQSSTGASVKNHRVTLKKHIRIADGGFGKTTDSKSFDNTVVGQISAVQTVNLRSFLSAGDITISSDNPAFRVGSADNTEALVWAVGANACASTNGAAGTPAGGGTLGDINLYDVNVYFCPTDFGAQSGTVTISDGVNSVTVSVTGTAVKESQIIMWDQDLTTINTTDNITLNAAAENDVNYISSDSTIAYAEGNQLIINKYGQVTLTAVAAESERYEQVTLSKNITINAVQPSVSVWPTVEPIAYQQTLAADMLLGGEAEVVGYFEWNTELNQALVPGVHALAVRFIPTNTAYYAPVDGTVAVTVTKAHQSIVWEQDFSEVYVVDTLYLEAKALTELYYEITDYETGIIDENQLVFFKAGTLRVDAIAKEDDFYYGDTLSIVITINPEKNTSFVTEYPTATSIVYGQMLGESMLEGGAATVDGEFKWNDGDILLPVGEHYMLAIFAPAQAELYADVEIMVEVVVTQAPQTIDWTGDVPAMLELGDTVALTATASSGLEIVYELDVEGVVEIDGEYMIAIGEGTVNVTATQDGLDEFGKANYLPADSVTYTITVIKSDVNTGLEAVEPNANTARKIIRNGLLYVIRGEHTYNALGELIR